MKPRYMLQHDWIVGGRGRHSPRGRPGIVRRDSKVRDGPLTISLSYVNLEMSLHGDMDVVGLKRRIAKYRVQLLHPFLSSLLCFPLLIIFNLSLLPPPLTTSLL